MDLLDRLIFLSEWVCFILFNREEMTLSAKSHEVARLRGHKSCVYSFAIDLLFWFDPHHCRNAYLWYRYKRRNRYRSLQCLSIDTLRPLK